MFRMITSPENCAIKSVRGCVSRIKGLKDFMASICEQGEHLDKIMLKGEWQKDSTAMKYLSNSVY